MSSHTDYAPPKVRNAKANAGNSEAAAPGGIVPAGMTLPQVQLAQLNDEPLKLGDTSITSLDALTERTAQEVEGIAATFEAASKDVVKYLNELAAAIRGNGKSASDHLREFVGQSNAMINSVKVMRDGLNSIK